ncbi:hypothetical protein [Croceimicrobium sp.]|uniref:hypothetical protein n=1 Tax=Croceimicrobium sp. TaxID=2828340 RepID=UPI003BA953B3
MKLRLFLLFVIFQAASLQGQNKPCACCEAPFRQFDFWLGNWEVRDTSGQVLGNNSIVKAKGDCLIQEHWQGQSGGSGHSMNYYASTDSSWHQLWVGGDGTILNLVGGLENDAMVLRSQAFKSKSGVMLRHQIQWIPLADGSLIQHWQLINEKGKALKSLFYGVYYPEN